MVVAIAMRMMASLDGGKASEAMAQPLDSSQVRASWGLRIGSGSAKVAVRRVFGVHVGSGVGDVWLGILCLVVLGGIWVTLGRWRCPWGLRAV